MVRPLWDKRKGGGQSRLKLPADAATGKRGRIPFINEKEKKLMNWA